MAGRRRGKGEGSIYCRKDGRWVGQYEVNGKRRYGYGRTRKEVAEKLNKALAEAEHRTGPMRTCLTRVRLPASR